MMEKDIWHSQVVRGIVASSLKETDISVKTTESIIFRFAAT